MWILCHSSKSPVNWRTFYYYKKTSYIMYAAIAAAALNVVLNYICIARFGYMAAAYTTLAAYIVLAFGQGVAARKVCKQKRIGDIAVYNDRAVALMAVVTIGLCLSGLLLYEHTALRYAVIAVGCVLGGVFGYRLWKMRAAQKKNA